MRKKIITFLYSHKLFAWLLPMFHLIIGHSRIYMGRDNVCDTSTTNIYRSSIIIQKGMRQTGNCFKTGKLSDFHTSTVIFYGHDNIFEVGDNIRIHNSSFYFSGNHNKVFIGNNGWINGLHLIIEGDSNTIIIGDGIFIYGNTRIYCVQGSRVTIEAGCMLSDQIEIRTTDNHSIIDMSSGQRINYEEDVVLHKHVWLGMHVIVLKGTEIAEGCIVGAGTVCTKKYMLPHAVIAGIPGKIVRENVDWKMPRI